MRILSSVSRTIPPVSGAIPLVSAVIPLVSALPPVTLPRFWGVMPRRRWGETTIPVTRRREIAPTEMGLLSLLAILLTAPVSIPLEMLSSIAKQIREQVEYESDQETTLKERLLEIKMRYEMGEISEEAYKESEAKIREEIEFIKK